MPTTYTSLLGLALPATGELSGTWGSTVNTEITSLLDTAVAGTTTLSTDADVTLSTTTGAANQARQAIILWTANGTVTRNITAPAASKTYVVINASAGTQSIVFRGVGPTAGVTVVKGESAVVAWNGSDFIKVSNTSGAGAFTNLSVSGTTTLSGLTASTALALDASKNVVSVTNTGTGNNVLATSPTLITPNLGTPSAIVLTNASGTASININGTVGATTPTTGAFTTVAASAVDGFRNTSAFAAIRLLQTAGGVGYRWALANDGNFYMQRTADGFATAASTPMFVGSNDRIGIGTTSPDALLTVAGVAAFGAGTALLPSLAATGDLDTGMWFPAANTVAWSTGGLEAMRISSARNVGIGTTNPTQLLHVNGNTKTTAGFFFGSDENYWYQAAANMAALRVGTGADTAYFTVLASAGLPLLNSSGTALLFGTVNAERMRITSAGDVAIGTTDNANSRLRVRNDRAVNGYAQTWGTANGASFENDTVLGFDGSRAFFGNFQSFPLAFVTNNQERMRITSGGNVGIGTTNPLQPLHVIGSARFQGNIFNVNGFATVDFLESAAGVGFRWALNNDGTFRLQRSANGTYSDATTPILFDASGNVGIGTTSPAVKLEVAGQIRTEAPTGGTAANWRLGTVHTVTPTSPNRTIEVDIGGTIYYLHAKTTNN